MVKLESGSGSQVVSLVVQLLGRISLGSVYVVLMGALVVVRIVIR